MAPVASKRPPRAATIGETLKHAEQCLARGEITEAEAVCRRLLRAHPKLGAAEHFLGVIAHHAGRPDEAIAHVRRAVELEPRVALFHANLGEMLRLAGRVEAAAAEARRALELDPDNAPALNNLGITLFDQGKFEEALGNYDRAIALKGDYAESHSNRGNALQRLQRFSDAETAYRRALELRPNFVAALHNLGTCLLEQQKVAEAEAAAQRALTLDANSSGALNLMGRIAFQRGATPASVGYFRRALGLDPNLAEAYNNLGNALRELGRLDEAEVAFREAIRLQPETPGYYGSLAAARTVKRGDPMIAALQALAEKSAALPAADRVQLNFALGKTYADLGEPDRAIAHLLAGNAGKRAMISYDEAATFTFFDLIEAAFTPQLVAQKSGGGDPSPLPIFVLGMPRSGTTLIEQIIASHPWVHGGGELKTFKEIIDRGRDSAGNRVYYPDFVPAMDDRALKFIGENYVAALRKLIPAAASSESGDAAPAKVRITDKLPGNFYNVGLIYLALPNAKIIHAVRDPLDTCVSCFSKLFTEGQSFTYDLGELGRFYRRYRRLMEHWRRVLPEGAMLDVSYEEVVADVERQARRIVAFCELPWDDRCLSFHQTERSVRTASASQVRQPIYKSAVGRWRAYEKELGPLMAALGIVAAQAGPSSTA